MTLDDVKALAEDFKALPDDRPGWLRALDTDPTSTYYRFFFHFARRMRPRVCFEIGTCEGKSAAHLAAGNPDGLVITLDVRPESKDAADLLHLPNLVAVLCDSLQAPQRLKWMPEIDVLFVDGDHVFDQAYSEYELYRSSVRDGGLVFFDDIRIAPDMEAMWRAIPDPKEELNGLHYTGFGVAKKDPSIRVAPMADLNKVLRR